MNDLSIIFKFIPLGLTALIPVINPIGSAMIFLGFARSLDHQAIKKLAKQISINTVLFLGIVEISGLYVLRFFGISLPIVQVAGGLVLASMGWGLLTKSDPETSTSATTGVSAVSLEDKAFYPLTFPITAGPGCIVVAVTLSAHASRPTLLETGMAFLGLLLGTGLIGVIVYFSYAYADRIAARLSPAVTQGVLRVISFILLCIGGEITWNGLQTLIKTFIGHGLQVGIR